MHRLRLPRAAVPRCSRRQRPWRQRSNNTNVAQSSGRRPLGAPGSLYTSARLLRPVSMLMRLDLPTFDRPMTANSGGPSFGHCDTSTLLVTNSADLTRTLVGGGSAICTVGNSSSPSPPSAAQSPGA